MRAGGVCGRDAKEIKIGKKGSKHLEKCAGSHAVRFPGHDIQLFLSAWRAINKRTLFEINLPLIFSLIHKINGIARNRITAYSVNLKTNFESIWRETQVTFDFLLDTTLC